MFYAWDVTIPANKSASSPTEQTLKLTAGVITHVGVKFPAGCHGMVRVRLLHQTSQLVPLSRGEWVTGDDEEAETESYFELWTAPYSLRFHGCSPGTTYSHTVTVRVTVLPKAVASMLPLLEILSKLMHRLGLT